MSSNQVERERLLHKIKQCEATDMCDAGVHLVNKLVAAILEQGEPPKKEEEDKILEILKVAVSKRRYSINKITCAADRDEALGRDGRASIAREYKSVILDELSKLVELGTDLVTQMSNIPDLPAESCFNITKFKADSYRYLAESCLDSKEMDKYRELSQKAYLECRSDKYKFPVHSHTHLGLELNWAVFLYEHLQKHSQAIQVAKEALEKASKELGDGPRNTVVTNYLTLLKDNLNVWQMEKPQ